MPPVATGAGDKADADAPGAGAGGGGPLSVVIEHLLLQVFEKQNKLSSYRREVEKQRGGLISGRNEKDLNQHEGIRGARLVKQIKPGGRM